MCRLARQSAALHSQVELQFELLRASSEQQFELLRASSEQQFKQMMWQPTNFYRAQAPVSLAALHSQEELQF